jgi:hypothetical protein
MTGRDSEGLVVTHLEEVSPELWRTTEPVPADGSWKTMIRLHDGRDLAALPLFLPEDSALDEPEIPMTDSTRVFDEEKLLLQRELEDDVPGWLWLVAAWSSCCARWCCWSGWAGVLRYARTARPGADPTSADGPVPGAETEEGATVPSVEHEPHGPWLDVR